MHPILRIMGIATVFVIVTLAWFVLGGVTIERTNSQTMRLGGEVADLWGQPQMQHAPTFTYHWTTTRTETSTETVGGQEKQVRRQVRVPQSKAVSPDSTDVDVSLGLDQRLKGLMWYSLYDVGFSGRWIYTHPEDDDLDGALKIGFQFPSTQGLYDNFRFVVDGEDMSSALQAQNGQVEVVLDVNPGQTVTLEIGYMSRGMDQWTYVPAVGVANLENFNLSMNTDYSEIDFPAGSMSPSAKEETDKGWNLTWAFKRVVTGHNIAMTTPERIQPGDLASSMTFSAPISLAFFFLILFVLGTLRNIDIHPINYLLLGGAFFAFHLLFAYSVDHLQVIPAFALSSVVSVLLVVSYLRLVVSSRFAFVEAGLAQTVYLVGFSLAHFWDGFTGLTVTVLSIVTLFLLMQLTGRIRWSEVLMRRSGTADHDRGTPVVTTDTAVNT